MKVENINGYKVLVHNNEHNLARVQVVVNVGAFNETKENSFGAAHYLEHMAFKGTEFNEYKYLNKEISKLGDTNACTSEDRTIYYINCRSSHVKEALDLLLEMLFYPKFLEEEFKKEKTVILEEYKTRINDPGCFFWDKLSEEFRNAHRVIGTENSISNMTIESLRKFRKQNYTKQNILFTVIGGIDENAIKKQFKIYFNSVDEMLERCPSMDVSKLNESMGEFYPNIISLEENYNDSSFTHPSTQAYIALATNGMDCNSNYENNYVASVFSNALGGGMHSILFDRLREDLGLCYDAGIYYSSMSNGINDYIIYSLLDKSNVDKAVNEINNILKKVQTEGISEELLEVSKENYLYSSATIYETSNGLSNLAAGYFVFDKFVSFKEKCERVEKITNRNIKEFANKYLNKFKLVVMNGR